jgi:hypothetical protein
VVVADWEEAENSVCILCQCKATSRLDLVQGHESGFSQHYGGVDAQTRDASASLLCAKGLKSSLILMGVCLISRLPKNGLRSWCCGDTQDVTRIKLNETHRVRTLSRYSFRKFTVIAIVKFRECCRLERPK